MNIRLENIGKRYDADWIFRGITSEFTANSVYGLIGFNGSGKSTLLQIISGFITPTEGTILFDDGRVKVESVFRSLSLAGPYISLPVELTVQEAADSHFKHKPFISSYTPKSVLDEVQLSKHKDKQLSKLSSGMRQRLALALAIYSDSTLLLLDEPCANLDSNWSDWFNRCIESQKADRTIIISSNSQEVELENVTEPVLNVSQFNP
jgi:ABC-type multidrug transport system ATPase subunit